MSRSPAGSGAAAAAAISQQNQQQPQQQQQQVLFFRSLKEQRRFQKRHDDLLDVELAQRRLVERGEHRIHQQLIDVLVRSSIREQVQHDERRKLVAREQHFRMAVDAERRAWEFVVAQLMSEYEDRMVASGIRIVKRVNRGSGSDLRCEEAQQQQEATAATTGRGVLSIDEDEEEERENESEAGAGAAASPSVVVARAVSFSPEVSAAVSDPRRQQIFLSSSASAASPPSTSSSRRRIQKQQQQQQKTVDPREEEYKAAAHVAYQRARGVKTGAPVAAGGAFDRPNPFVSLIERDTTLFQIPEIVKARIDTLLSTHGQRNAQGTSVVERTAEQRKAQQITIARSRRDAVNLATLQDMQQQEEKD